MATEINPRTGQEYYASDVESIKNICRIINIGTGRMDNVTPDTVRYYMNLVEETIESCLEEYYFVPIRPYNIVMPNGTTKKQFPGRLRKVAQYWTAGLLIQSEFQTLEQNVSEASMKYIEDSNKELHRMTLYNQRLPGQNYKSSWSRTMLPTMQPGVPPTENW